MNFIKPEDDNNFLVVCENCNAIINFSREDCYCVKELDRMAFERGKFQNVTRAYINCPNCHGHQDVIAGLRYVKGDKHWF
jgi:Zn finger protein HypA/HybF involved in hydrogenase expression